MVTWMPESSCFRTIFGTQRVRRSEKLTKSARQHFYLISSLIHDKWSKKTSLLLWSEILGLSGNTLTEDHMYFCQNTFCIFEIYVNFCAFSKIRSTVDLKYFGSYILRKMRLLECPKPSLSEPPSGVNVVPGSKH